MRKGGVRDLRKAKVRNNHLGKGESEFVKKEIVLRLIGNIKRSM